MLQSYNCIRFSLSVVNSTKIKILIRNHSVTKGFCILTKNTFLILPICPVIQFWFSILWFWAFGLLFKHMKETHTFPNFFKLFWQGLSRELFYCSYSKTQHKFFYKFSLLFITTDFTFIFHYSFFSLGLFW